MSGSQSLESLHNVSPIEGSYPQKSAILNEKFEIRSIDGIIVAGKTSKLDIIYITLLQFNQEDIF